MVSFLADLAVRRGDGTEAIRLFRNVLTEEPESSGVRLELARLFMQRSISADADAEDVRTAEEYALGALEQRRRWRDDTADVLAVYLRCLALQSRFRDMLQAASAPPVGSASAREASATEVALLGIDAAKRLGRKELLPQLASAITDDQDRKLAVEGFEVSRGDHDAQVTYMRRLLDRALERGDGQAALGNAMQLAELGVDSSASLRSNATALGIPAGALRLIEVIAAARTDPVGSLATLRALARTEIAAAEIVVDILSDAPSPQQAIEACDLYYQLFKSPSFLMSQAGLHLRHGQRGEAVALLEDALLHGRLEGESLRHAHILLGEHYGEAQNWSTAAQHFRAALKDSAPADAAAFWNLLRCLIVLGDFAAARRVLDEQELEPANEEQIKVWAEVVSETGWTETTASFAVTLALQEDRSPQLATALLGRVVMQTQGTPPAPVEESDEESDELGPGADSRPLIPGSIHARAFAALDVLMERRGDQIGFKKFTFDEATFLDDFRALFADRDTRPLKALARQIKRGLVPIGMLCEVRSDPYGWVLANRIRDVRVASYPDGDSHEAETQVALGARGGRVIVDLSAVDLALELDVWDQLAAEFNVIVVTTQQKVDAASSVVAARSATASRGTLGVDADGNVRMVELDPKDQLAVLQRCEAIERMTRGLVAIPVVGEPTATAALKDHGEPVWLTSVELAGREGVTLWSDDLAQRRLAATLGIPSFGTVNLIESKILARLEPPASSEAINAAVGDQHAFVLELIDHRVVDQPVTEPDLLANIEAHPGEFAPGAEVLARATWWTEPNVLSTWLRLIAAVQQHAPESARAWQSRAMIGLVEATPPEVAPRVLALLAALGCGVAPEVEDAAEGFALADAICRDFDLPIASAHVAWAAASVADRLPGQDAASFASAVTAKLAERLAPTEDAA